MPDSLSPSDLTHVVPCDSCSGIVHMHTVPLGEPTYLVHTGYCFHCQRSRYSLDGIDRDARLVARQHIAWLQQVFG